MTLPPIVSPSSSEKIYYSDGSPIKKKKTLSSIISGTPSPSLTTTTLISSSSDTSLTLYPSLSLSNQSSTSLVPYNSSTFSSPPSVFNQTEENINLVRTILQTERIRRIRWRLLREIYLITTTKDEYKSKNFEQLFDLFSVNKVNMSFFIMKFQNYYQYDNKLNMDIKLKKLFLTYTNSSTLLLGAKEPSTAIPSFINLPATSNSFSYTLTKLGTSSPSFLPSTSSLLKNLTNPYHAANQINTMTIFDKKILKMSNRIAKEGQDVDQAELNRTNFVLNLTNNTPIEDDMSSCNDKVNILYILISFKLLYSYKFTYNRALELFLVLFDYFSENISSSKLFDLKNSSNVHSKLMKNSLRIKHADEVLFLLLFIPCLHDNEVAEMKKLYQNLMDDIHQNSSTSGGPNNSISKAELSNLFSTKHSSTLEYWNCLLTLRLPKSDLLDRLNTNQIFHLDNFDRLIYNFKLNQAEEKYSYHLIYVTFKEWKLNTIFELEIKKFIWIKYSRKLVKLFHFWLKLTKVNKRKRFNNIISKKFNRMVILSHYFTRIKLYIKNNRKLQAILGPSEIYRVNKKKIDLFMNHMRNYLYFRELRYNFKVFVTNSKKLKFFTFIYQKFRFFFMRKSFFTWKLRIIQIKEYEEYEYQVNENQLALKRRLEEIEESSKFLAEYEKKKQEEIEEAKKLAEENRKKQVHENYLQKKNREKESDEKLLLQIQKEDRLNRIKNEMNILKYKFNKSFISFAENYLLKTREKVKKYIEDPANKEKVSIESSNLLTKFHENPSDHNRVKERVLKDYLNIFVLFLDHYLKIKFAYGIKKKKKKNRNLDNNDSNSNEFGETVLNSIILEKIKYNYYTKYFPTLYYSYDTNKKGYLNYSDLKQLIKDINAPFNPAQINKICVELDPYKVERIDYSTLVNSLDRLSPTKLEESSKSPYFFLPSNQFTMEELKRNKKNFPINFMFALGSPWKLYIDPKENVICYHNLDTNEKVLEYEMTKEHMESIFFSNLYGQNEEESLKYLRELRMTEWNKVIKNYMVNRIQVWYKRVKKRIEIKYKYNLLINVQKKNLDKILLKIKNYFLNLFSNNRIKKRFYKQLFFTYEKYYDPNTQTYYYYNHKSNISSYNFPLANYYPNFIRECEFAEWQPYIPEGADYYQYLEVARKRYLRLEEKKNNGEFGTINSPLILKEDDLKETPEEKKITISYYHKIAGTIYPGKPDGFPLCSTCCFEMAIRFCNECSSNFCFHCHKVYHSSPMGFLQATPPSLEDITSEGKIFIYFYFEIINLYLLIL